MTDTTFDIRKVPVEDLQHCGNGVILGVFDDTSCLNGSEDRVLVVMRGPGVFTIRVSPKGEQDGFQVIRCKPKLKGRVLYHSSDGTVHVSCLDYTETEFKEHGNGKFIRIITEIKELPVEEV